MNQTGVVPGKAGGYLLTADMLRVVWSFTEAHWRCPAYHIPNRMEDH
jgi:hypothetical protein